MSFEKYSKFFEDYENGVTVRPKCSTEFSFSADPKRDRKYRLFAVGETSTFYLWKNEPDTPQFYRLLTDSLDSKNANQDQFCLDLSCVSETNYIKRAYKKIMWKPVLSYLEMANLPTDWKTGISVKAENLKINENGFLRMRVDIRFKKDGVSRHSIHNPADKTVIIDLPEGTYDWQKLIKEVEIPLDTAHVGVFVEGKGYSGKVWVERPVLSAIGQNLLPPFAPSVVGKEKFEWTAQFLSRKEWPEFEVKLNGETVFCGEVFERCHTCSEWEIDLPKEYLKDENILEVKLISNYHDALPYCIKELGIIEQPDANVSVISQSAVGVANGKACVLLYTNKPHTILKMEYLSDNLSGENEYVFDDAGYHGIALSCKAPCENARFKIICGDTVINTAIDRIVIKENDDVITGTGDMVYIGQELDYMMEYLAWYISNNVGNFLTIRPVYRWAGSRTLNKECWEPFVKVLNEMGIQYVLMCDGRELPGINALPDDELLKGEGYLGRQNHETDGAIFYWWQRAINGNMPEEQWHDLCHIAYTEDPVHTNCEFKPTTYIHDGEVMYRYINKNYPRDVKVAEEYTANQLRAMSSGETRNTGPSVMFKTFKQAGYTWVGAETMYSSLELLVGFMRGFCKSNNMKKFGVHHALQWSSTPLKDIKHYDRYRLALYLSYMLGVTDINTEEGLWRMEEYFLHPHRFTEECQEHLKQEQDFYRYVKTHSRTGEFYTPFAFVSGKHDGVLMFGSDNMWGWDNTPQTCAEDSWCSLLKTVYPLSRPQAALYRHGVGDWKEPLGYYTGTPMGNADVIPMESSVDILSTYKLLVFAGYNMCESEDADRLLSYVRQGGKVILTRAHLTNTTDYEKIRHFDLSFENHAFSFTNGDAEFVNDSKNGVSLAVCTNGIEANEVLERTDSGFPLVCKYKIGEGEVILFNTKVYPAHQSIKQIYENIVKIEISNAVKSENIWSATGNDVETAAYKQADGSMHIYFIAVDWYNGREGIRKAELLMDNYRYQVVLPFGVMIKAVCKDGMAVWPLDEEGEVLSLNGSKISVQGSGVIPFVVAKNGKTETVTVDFSEKSVLELEF